MKRSLIALATLMTLTLSLPIATPMASTKAATKVQPTRSAVTTKTSYRPGLNRVTFESSGIAIVGHLYLPVNYQPGDQLPAVIVSGSWTTVKEQMAGAYAQKIADQGFATLAFDSRSFGESGGQLRGFESPTVKIEDLKQAISFLETVEAIDRDRIAAVGICAGAGYVTTLAAEDSRLKALVTIAPWIHDPAIVNQVYGGKPNVEHLIRQGRYAAERFAQKGQAEYVLATSNTDKTAVMYGEIDYYQNPKRGAIPAWDNRFAIATWAEWLTFNPMAKATQVKIPTLFIHSEKGAIPEGAKQFFAAMPTQDKQFVWMNEYQQFDFYDQPQAMEKSIALVVQHLNAAL